MPMKPLRPCKHQGCPELVTSGYCEKHTIQDKPMQDRHKSSAFERGFNYRWYNYSKQFLRKPENVFCKLQLPGCTNLAKCVDHIVQPNGSDDPLFWDVTNHQAACIHCNSVKGHRTIIGTAEPFTSK